MHGPPGILAILGVIIWMVGYCAAVVGWMILFVDAFASHFLKGLMVLVGPFLCLVGAGYGAWYLATEMGGTPRNVVVVLILGGLALMGMGWSLEGL
jgi:hypothetical protein